MSRGQIPQIFIFLTALLVIGATVFLGAKFVLNLQTIGCDQSDTLFLRELQSILTDGAVYGSRTRANLGANCDALDLCVVDSRQITGATTFVGDDKNISAIVRGGAQVNIFLRTRDAIIPRGYDERIVLSNPYDESAAMPIDEVCVPAVGGKFSFTTNGYGRYVQITP